MYNGLIIEKAYTTEIDFTNGAPTAGSQQSFQSDVKQLRNVYLQGCETYTADQLTTSPSGIQVVTPAEARSMVVVLTENVTEKVFRVPYMAFNAATNGGFIRLLANLKFNLDKSYIAVLDGGVANNRAGVFTFYYDVDKLSFYNLPKLPVNSTSKTGAPTQRR